MEIVNPIITRDLVEFGIFFLGAILGYLIVFGFFQGLNSRGV